MWHGLIPLDGTATRRRLAGLVLCGFFVVAPRGGPSASPDDSDREPSSATSPDRAHWSFRPLRRAPPPGVRHDSWVRNPIDRFVLRRLEDESIAPSPEADRATLIRRVSLDLIGLPPTPDEVGAYLDDTQRGAYERLVDRLLSSPHYGERWARPWLDLCHYADSDGYLTDQLRPVAWRYRQWLVDALNADMPFDQFTVAQLAGDLLPGATIQQKLGTGFLRNTLSSREGGADPEEFRVEQVVDRTSTVGTVWLGLTVGCARCHDHKYDPISQEEFYELYAIFDSADEVNIDAPLPGELEPYLTARPEYDRRRRELLAPLAADVATLRRRWERKLLYAAAHPGEDHRWDRQWELLGLVWGGGLGEGQLEGAEIVKLAEGRRSQDQSERLLDYFLASGSLIDDGRFKTLKLSQLRGELEKLKSELPKLTRAPTMRETQNPRTAYVHIVGDFRDVGDVVQPRLPACLADMPPSETMDRLSFARWLVSGSNPLGARVTVNRIWQELFGRGLVSTSEDFGVRGERPSHPELLDWLSERLIDLGWSVKAVHRLIVTSATYRQSSRSRPELQSRDPDNALLARQASRRLSAEAIRDASLAVSGLLRPMIGRPSVRPPQPESVVKEGFGQHTWKASLGADRYRRGLYTLTLRTSPFAQSVTFDAPDPGRVCTRRERTNTPLQALTLLNDPVFFEAARALATRILRETGSDRLDDRIDYGFRLSMARRPSGEETARLKAYFHHQTTIFRKNPTAARAVLLVAKDVTDPAERAAFVALSSVLLNLHEFITRE